jgi:hypothetical protein
VELLSVAYDDGAPGLVNTAIHERGKTVVALAWPQRSYEIGEEVFVERIRGALSGDAYSGEWILSGASAGYNRCMMYGLGGATFLARYPGSYTDVNGYLPYGQISGGFANDGAWSFPWLVGVRGNAGGRVFAERGGDGSALGPPTAWDDWWLECEAFTWYRISIHTTWRVYSVGLSDATTWLAASPHVHDYTDDGAALVTSPSPDLPMPQRSRSVTSIHAIVRTELHSSWGSRHHMGSSSLEVPYLSSSSYGTQCHSGVAMASGVYRPGPLKFRIRVYREDTFTSLANADIESMSVTVEQASDPIDPSA